MQCVCIKELEARRGKSECWKNLECKISHSEPVSQWISRVVWNGFYYYYYYFVWWLKNTFNFCVLKFYTSLWGNEMKKRVKKIWQHWIWIINKIARCNYLKFCLSASFFYFKIRRKNILIFVVFYTEKKNAKIKQREAQQEDMKYLR